MADQPITWQTITIIISVVGSIVVGMWVLMTAAKKEFDNSRKESNSGRQRLYDRVDEMGKEMRVLFTPRDLFHSELRRLDEGLAERDRQISDLNDRLTGQCPLPQRGAAP